MLLRSEMVGTLQAVKPCVDRFCAELELSTWEMPEGFALKLSLLSACSPTV